MTLSRRGKKPRFRDEMQRKRLKKFIFMSLCIAFVSAVFVAGCRSDSQSSALEENSMAETENEIADTVNVFFSTDEGHMVPITYPVKGVSGKDLVKFSVEKLLSGPPGDILNSTIPEGTRLKNWYVNNGTACVDFTKDFLYLENSGAALHAINSLCLTLGSLPSINNVQLLVEGEMKKQVRSIPVGQPLQRRYPNFTGSEEPEYSYTAYFTDKQAMYLVPVTLAASGGYELPRKAVEKLITGPEREGLTATIWPGTELLGLEINDGLAEVNLTEQSIGYGGGSTAERLFVKSLLLTLGQFEEVQKVQILIEGEKIGLLPEGTKVKDPLDIPEYVNMAADGQQ